MTHYFKNGYTCLYCGSTLLSGSDMCEGSDFRDLLEDQAYQDIKENL
jgi:hypothetical protein